MNFPLLTEPVIPIAPSPDTHCFDEDTKTDCWSHSPEQLQEYAKQVREAALEEAAIFFEAKNQGWHTDADTSVALEIRNLK